MGTCGKKNVDCGCSRSALRRPRNDSPPSAPQRVGHLVKRCLVNLVNLHTGHGHVAAALPLQATAADAVDRRPQSCSLPVTQTRCGHVFLDLPAWEVALAVHPACDSTDGAFTAGHAFSGAAVERGGLRPWSHMQSRT